MMTKIINDFVFIVLNKQVIILHEISLAMDIQNQKYAVELASATGVTV